MSWPTFDLHSICRPRQWPTIPKAKLTEKGYTVYGANGPIGYYSEYNHEHPTLLITCRGATCGSINICSPKSYATGNSMALDDLDTKKVSLEFLTHYLKGYNFGPIITGVAQPQITGQSLRRVKIPLPPLDEQKRIAAILDAADELRAKRRQTLVELDTLIQSTFLDMFGDPVTNPMGWEVVPFQTIGTSRLGKMLDKGKETGDSPFPYLANFNVQWGRFNLSSLRTMDFSPKDRKEFQLKRGDVLICEGGEVGRTAIWQQEATDVYFQKALHRVRLDHKKATPEFCQYYMWFMAKHGGFKDFTNVATIAHLTGIKLKKLPVPLPPISPQQTFTTIVEKIEAQKARCQAHLDELDTLFASLQSRAFKGEL